MLQRIKEEIKNFIEKSDETFDPQNAVLPHIWDLFEARDFQAITEIFSVVKACLYQGDAVFIDTQVQARKMVQRCIDYSSGKELDEDKKFDNFVNFLALLAPDNKS